MKSKYRKEFKFLAKKVFLVKVKDCMCNDVCYCLPDTTISDCAKLMNSKHIGYLPVCDTNQKLVGVVTDRDIALRCIACDKDSKSTKVKDIMSSNVYSCTPEDEMKTVEDKMSEYQIRRLPIVDRNKVVGIISIGDLAKNEKIEPECVGNTFGNICWSNTKNAE